MFYCPVLTNSQPQIRVATKGAVLDGQTSRFIKLAACIVHESGIFVCLYSIVLFRPKLSRECDVDPLGDVHLRTNCCEHMQ